MKIKEYLMINKGHKSKVISKREFKVKNKYKHKDLRDNKQLVKLLEDLFEYSKLTEEYSFVVAYYMDLVLGIFQLSHGTDEDCDMQMKTIFKFLLLVGADSFTICHNHPNCTSRMSQDDYNRTTELIAVSHYLGIKLNSHLIVGKNNYRCVFKEILKMQELNLTDVNEYYGRS